MTFEILFLTVANKLENKNLKWLADRRATYSSIKQKLGEKYYNMLMEYGKQGYVVNNNLDRLRIVVDSLVGKTFYWLINVYYERSKNSDVCGDYRYSKETSERVELVHRFVKLIDIIETD